MVSFFTSRHPPSDGSHLTGWWWCCSCYYFNRPASTLDQTLFLQCYPHYFSRDMMKLIRTVSMLFALTTASVNGFQPPAAVPVHVRTRSDAARWLFCLEKPQKFRLCDRASRGSIVSLMAKKKKAGNAAGTSSTSAKKMQVKLLKHIAGTGQAGQVISVTPAFYQNKLRPQQAAVPITDEEVKQEQQNQQQREREMLQQAKEMQAKIQDESFEIVIQRKAGPEGQLFGGVSAKCVMDELKQVLKDCPILKQKSVKITNLNDSIKELGKYTIEISLLDEVSASFTLQVVPEN